MCCDCLLLSENTLKQTISKNDLLAKKTKSLELSLKNTNEKLKVESRMRKQAELVSSKSDSRYEVMQAKSNNQNLHVESTIQMRQAVERNETPPLRIVDSGVITEMVSNTSQTIRGQLNSAKQKLKGTEDQLEKSQSLVKDLEKTIQKNNANNLRELQKMKAEIDEARNEIQSECTSTFQRDDGEEHTELIEENAMLREEMSCLREILYEQDVGERTMNNSMISKVTMKETEEEYNQDIDGFRQQLEILTDENTILQGKVTKFESERISFSKGDNNEIDTLKEERDRLNDELQMIHNEHEKKMDDSEEFWRNEIQKVETTRDINKQKESECSEMRSEILALTESLYDAQQKYSNISNKLSAIENHSMGNEIALQNDLMDSENVVEVKEKEIARLEESLTSAGEEVRLLSEEISEMSLAFAKTRENYNTVASELATVHDILKKSRKEAEMRTEQNDAQNFTISSKLSLESEDEKKMILKQLQKALSDNALLQNKLNENTDIQVRNKSDRINNIESSQDESETERSTEEKAEISLLRSQFTKLFRKNENITEKVKETEAEILSFRKASNARTYSTEKLQNEINHAVGEAKKRNHAFDEFTISMENRMNLAEDSLDIIEEEVSIAMKSLKNSNLVSNKESESISSRLDEGRVTPKLDRYNTTDPSIGENTTKLRESARNKGGKGSNEWLVQKYQKENDKKVKAAIAATMAYVLAADKSPTQSRNISSAQSPFEDTDISHVCTISETNQKLENNSSYQLATSTDDSSTKRDVNVEIKLHKNSEGRADEMDGYHRTLMFAGQGTENESRGDIETAGRE